MATKYRITSETPSGLVNWVNKIYTTINPITRIESFTIAWVPYGQFAFSGNTIVLDDAPVSGIIEVTYEYETSKDYLDNTWWIVGEIASGTSDWTNKQFSTFFPISSIDEVRVNGVVVTGYTFVGNSIVLVAAPLVNQLVAVDYFRKDLWVVDYQRDTYYTLKEVRDLVYSDISQDDVSIPYQPELVNQAIKDWVSEIVSIKVDKSRNISFSLTSAGKISLAPIANSNSTVTLTSTTTIPSLGRVLTVDWDFLDYSSITDSVATISSAANFPTTTKEVFVWYRLPRNIKRIIRIFSSYPNQEAWSIVDFLNETSGYIVNNWFLYLPTDGTYTIEVELSETVTSDDDSLIYIDKDDIGVVVYYALRQLYASRENEKLANTSQLYMDKLMSYKRKINKKRVGDSRGKLKTSPRLWQ